MAQPEMKLSVEVPESNEEEANHNELDMDQENEEPKMSLNLQTEEEETERTKYGLNSPKKRKPSRDLDDEAEAQEGDMTPATKLRQQAGINSPKQQKTMTWGNAQENTNTNALAGVITQVAPPSDNKSASGGGVESLVTQVSREDAQTMAPMNTTKNEEEEKSDQKQQSAGICACLSSLFTCCSSRSVEPKTAQHIALDNTSKSADKVQPATSTQTNATAAETKPQQEEVVESEEEEEEEENNSSQGMDYASALLPPIAEQDKGKRCLVLDLDETLVHSSFKPVKSDFVIPVEIDGVVHRVYVLKRPFVDEFLLECSKSYELVIFTASLSKYADPLLDHLDTHRVIRHRLFRESCTLHGSAYVKDMRKLGRSLKDVIFVDNSPHSYAFQPKNAVPITSWFDDQTDTQLNDFIPVLNTTLLKVKDVRTVLDAHNKPFSWLCRQANVDISKFDAQLKT